MRAALVIFLMALCSITVVAQGADANLRSDLETLHAKWFKAFDSGDGATMDQIEMDKLTLVMPSGVIWAKTKARAGEQLKRDPQTERALSAVSVRRFGDTAILTGILTTKSGKENSQEATTVVFVKNSGKWKIASAQWSPVTEADRQQNPDGRRPPHLGRGGIIGRHSRGPPPMIRPPNWAALRSPWASRHLRSKPSRSRCRAPAAPRENCSSNGRM